MTFALEEIIDQAMVKIRDVVAEDDDDSDALRELIEIAEQFMSELQDRRNRMSESN